MSEFITLRHAKLQYFNNKTQSKKKDGYFIGVDPGVKGGISLIKYEGNTCTLVKSFNTPVYSVFDPHLTEEKKKLNLRKGIQTEVEDVYVNRILFKEVNDILTELKEYTDYVVYEDVYGYCDQRADYAFTFGFASGGVYSLLIANGFKVCRVDPYLWKKTMKIPGKKDSNGKEKVDFDKEVWEHANIHIQGLKEEDFKCIHDYYKVEKFMDGKLESCMLGKYGATQFNTLKFEEF